MASFKHDAQGFLVGELLDVNRDLLDAQSAGMIVWRGIHSDVKAIARALGVQVRGGRSRQAGSTSQAGPARDSQGRYTRRVVDAPAGRTTGGASRSAGRAGGNGAAGSAGSTGSTGRANTTTTTTGTTGTTGAKRATPERAAVSGPGNERRAVVTPAGRNARGRFVGVGTAGAGETPDSVGVRDALGRFTGGAGGTSDKGGDADGTGRLTSAIEKLGLSLDGADQLDPTITAMKEVQEVLTPVGRGFGMMFGRNAARDAERKKEVWYKRLIKAITGKPGESGGGMGGHEAVQSGSFMGTLTGELLPKVMAFLAPILLAVGGVILGGLSLLGGLKLGELIYKWLSDSGIMTRIFDAIDNMKQAFSDAGGWIKTKYEGAKETVIKTYEGAKAVVVAAVSDFDKGMKEQTDPVRMAPPVLDASGRNVNDPRRLDRATAVNSDGRMMNDPRRIDAQTPELAPATSMAQRAGRAAGWVKKVYQQGTGLLGATSARFESGGKGAGTVSTGKGDNGGASYGTYQLSSKAGTLKSFLKATEYGEKFGDLKPGTPEFNAKWKETAKNDPAFGEAQHNFIKSTHYDPMVQKLKKDGLDVEGRGAALKDAVWSTSVQFGGDSTLFKRALKGMDPSKMTDAQIITAVQDYKAANNETLFAKSAPNIRAGTLGRATSEKSALLKLDAAGTLSAGAAKIPPVSIPSSTPERIAPTPESSVPTQLNTVKPGAVNVSMREPIGQDVGDRSIAHVVSGALGMP